MQLYAFRNVESLRESDVEVHKSRSSECISAIGKIDTPILTVSIVVIRSGERSGPAVMIAALGPEYSTDLELPRKFN